MKALLAVALVATLTACEQDVSSPARYHVVQKACENNGGYESATYIVYPDLTEYRIRCSDGTRQMVTIPVVKLN